MNLGMLTRPHRRNDRASKWGVAVAPSININQSILPHWCNGENDVPRTLYPLQWNNHDNPNINECFVVAFITGASERHCALLSMI
jgi:hypothetical protein